MTAAQQKAALLSIQKALNEIVNPPYHPAEQNYRIRVETHANAALKELARLLKTPRNSGSL